MKLTKLQRKQLKALLKKYLKQDKEQEIIYFIENYIKIKNNEIS